MDLSNAPSEIERAVLKLTSYKAGLPFYCAVMALTIKLEEKQREKSKS